MPFYTVHIPASDLDRPARSDKITLVAEKFSTGAFLLGPIWMIARRLWLAAAVWVAVAALLAFVIFASGLDWSAGILIFLALQILVGLEAGNLRRKALGRRDYATVDLVSADDLGNAEKVFFHRQETKRLAARPVTQKSNPHHAERNRDDPASTDQGIGLFLGGEAR